MEQIKDKLIQMLRDSGNVSEDLAIDSDSVLVDLGMNSITFIKLVVMIEQNFEIEFSDEDLDVSKFKTLKDIVALIEAKIDQAI